MLTNYSFIKLTYLPYICKLLISRLYKICSRPLFLSLSLFLSLDMQIECPLKACIALCYDRRNDTQRNPTYACV